MSIGNVAFKHLLGWLILGTKGGLTRARIIKTLKKKPQNANQLATLLQLDYKSIRHHLGVLQKHRIITSAGDRYGATYFLSQTMEENYALFEEIGREFWEKEKKELKQ
jgi:DNA-binding transcriptional ArsR family regulator